MFSLFTTMIAKLAPLYLTMGAGFGLARRSGDITKNLATLQIYFLVPIVIFTNVIKLDVKPELFLLPLCFLAVCVIMANITKYLAIRFKCDGVPALAQAGGTCNNGYLGIPVASILFPPEWLPLFIFTGLGGAIYESTYGYYMIARGHYNARDAVKKLATLPSLYAMAAGLGLGAMGLHFPAIWDDFARNVLGAFVIVGALIIGFGVAQVRSWKFDWTYLRTILVAKFLIWPTVMLTLLTIEKMIFGFLPDGYRACLVLISILPMAANSAAFAALFNITPDRMATAVALSTILGLVLIPLYAILLGLAPANVLNP